MRIFWQDALFLGGLIMMFLVGTMTEMIVAELSFYTTAAKLLEADPLARVALNFSYGIFLTRILSIAFLGGVYYLERNSWLKTGLETAKLRLSFYSIAVFLVFFQNILNDLPAFLAIVIKGG